MLTRLRFPDRAAAGRALAKALLATTAPPTVVLGIPRGGLLTAAPVARALSAHLAPAWVARLVSPREPAVSLGAVDLDGDATLNLEAIRAEGLADDEVAELAYHAHQRLLAEWERMPGLDPSSLLAGATAVVVDDVAATGLSLRAAMRWARKQFAKAVVLAVPVVDARIWRRLAADADRAVTLEGRDDGPIAASELYEDYRRVREDEVAVLLQARAESTAHR